MNWLATVVSLFLIIVGSIYILRPQSDAKWDKAVGSPVATYSVYKVMGFILVTAGVVFIVVFNYISLAQH